MKGFLRLISFTFQWKTKPVSDRPGWFHLRILRFRRAYNYKNSYGCFSFFFFSSRNKNQAPCYCFSAFVPPHSALQGGCHFADEKWSCSGQVTCPRPCSWDLVELNFELGFHTIFHQSPLSPVRRLLRCPLEFVIRVGADEVLLFFCPGYANFVLLEQAGDTSRKSITPPASLVLLSEPVQRLAQRSEKQLTDPPRQPLFIRVESLKITFALPGSLQNSIDLAGPSFLRITPNEEIHFISTYISLQWQSN